MSAASESDTLLPTVGVAEEETNRMNSFKVTMKMAGSTASWRGCFGSLLDYDFEIVRFPRRLGLAADLLAILR